MSFLVAVAAQRHPAPQVRVQRPRAPQSDSPLSPPAASFQRPFLLSPTSVAAGTNWERTGESKGLTVDLFLRRKGDGDMLVTGARGIREEWKGRALGIPGQSILCPWECLAVSGALSTLKLSKQAKELLQFQVHKEFSLITLSFPDFFIKKETQENFHLMGFFLMGIVQLVAAVTLHLLPKNLPPKPKCKTSLSLPNMSLISDSTPHKTFRS